MPTTRAAANWAASHVAALIEMWVIIAQHSGLVGAWRLTMVCKASRGGVKQWLRTLPRLVICGGYGAAGPTDDMWVLDLEDMRWTYNTNLKCQRANHACCAVRGTVVVLAGRDSQYGCTASVEILGYEPGKTEEHVFMKDLPQLSIGALNVPTAVSIDETESNEGQVLLIGGADMDTVTSAVHIVDLATGVCTPQCPLLRARMGCAAARLPDGRVVCVGGRNGGSDTLFDDEVGNLQTVSLTAEVLEPSDDGMPGGQWRELPAMNQQRYGGGGCVLSDGRFAVFGGIDDIGIDTTSCQVLTLDGEEWSWSALPPMHEARTGFACVAVGGCVIVAGGESSVTAEVYEEELGRWKRLPHGIQRSWMGSALMTHRQQL